MGIKRIIEIKSETKGKYIKRVLFCYYKYSVKILKWSDHYVNKIVTPNSKVSQYCNWCGDFAINKIILNKTRW